MTHYLICDTETGGVVAETDAVLQVAMVIVDEDQNIEFRGGDEEDLFVFNEFIYPSPDLLIHRAAIEATGIDMISVLTALREPIVARLIAGFLYEWWYLRDPTTKLTFAGYNAPFDWRMMKAIQSRTGIVFPYHQPPQPEEGYAVMPWKDIMLQAFRQVPDCAKNIYGNKKKAKLKEIAAHFHLAHDDAHDALADVMKTLQVWQHLEAM